MSSTGDIGSSSSNMSSVEKCTPNIVRHIQNALWEFTLPVVVMEVGQYKEFAPIAIVRIDRDAVLKVEKTSEEVVSVSCSIRSKMDDDGCFLRLYFTVIGVKEETKSVEIRFPDTCATVEYKAAFFSTLSIKEHYLYCVKCVFRLIETSYLSSERRVLLNRAFHNDIKASGISHGQLEDMSYILGRSSLDYTFTGREIVKDVSRKKLYIKRAFDYVKVLVGYFKAREKSDSTLPEIPIGEILGHICERENPVSVMDCMWFFKRVSFLDLTFLKTLCTEYILENLDSHVVLDVLSLSDEVEDEYLFTAASDFFMKNRREIFGSSRWEKMKGEKRAVVRCIVHRINHIHSPDFIWPPLFKTKPVRES